MKMSTRVFGDKDLRSRKRLFATRYEAEVKRLRFTRLAVVDTQENKVKFLDHVKEIDHDEQTEIKLGISNKTNEIAINFGKLQKMSFLDDNHNDGVNLLPVKQYGAVYTRKRKWNVRTDSSLNHSNFDENHGSNKMYEKKYFKKKKTKKIRTSLNSGLDGKYVLQGSTCTMNHGVFKVFGSVNSIPFFIVNFSSLPFYFLYIHSMLLLKFAFQSYTYIMHSVNEKIMENDIKVPPLDNFVVVKKARSARKPVPRVSLFTQYSPKIVPVPGVREIEGYAEETYVPFILPETYVISRSDEVARILEKSYPIYDMDADDAQWLKKLNNDFVTEYTFEKIIGAFERGIYCNPHDYSDVTSAVDRCQKLASNEVLESVYSYWMSKRKKKRSPLIRIFQCYRRKRVLTFKRHYTNIVLRKKRSFRRRMSKRSAEKQFDYKKAMLNDQKVLEEAAKAYLNVHETQEAAKRLEKAAIVKRKQAQALMEIADVATYRATMALRIADALAAGDGSCVALTVDH